MLSVPFDVGRLHALASILIRYGFGDGVRRLGMKRALARAGRVLPLDQLEELVALPTPVRLRRALEEMGPCFVKLGQILATRVDLFPAEWIAEFSRLQNAAPSVSFDQIRAEICEASGVPLETAFRFLDPAPLAAASIAQVHRARLHDGREVVVKVRRPGIRPLVESDLRLLEYAARRIESRFPQLRRFHPTGVVRQFKASITRELDLAAECRSAERIAASFADDANLCVPKVHWRYTNERMNVQDFVDGIPACDVQALDAAGVDRKRIARIGARMVLQMMLRDGFFHADPHAGNVFILRDGRVALIDFGMVGRLSETRRTEVVNLLYGLVDRDGARVAEVLLDWTGGSETEVEELTSDVDTFVDRYHSVPLGQLSLAEMLLEVTNLLRANCLALPADLALLVKVCITLDGLGRSLDPDFDMARQARPFLRRAIALQYAPDRLARQGARAVADVMRLLASAPRDLRNYARTIRRGGVRLRMQVDEIHEFSRGINHSANRLAGSMVIASLIVGSSIALTVEGGPTLLGLPAFGLLGFVGASLVGIWLLWSILRSGGGR